MRPVEDAKLLLEKFLSDTGAPERVKEYGTMLVLGVDHAVPAGSDVRAQQVLGTWLGNWGVLPADAAAGLAPGLMESCGQGQGGPGPQGAGGSSAAPEVADTHGGSRVGLREELSEACCEALRARGDVQALWEEVLGFAQRLAAAGCAQTWAVSLEVCRQTWCEEGILRLHVHACFRAPEGRRLSRRFFGAAAFRGCLPYYSPTALGARVRGTHCAAMYYVLAPKLGVLFAHGTQRPFTGFVVSPTWVMVLLQQEKIAVKVAREQIVRTGNNLTRRLADFDKWQDEIATARLRSSIAARTERLETTLRPFVSLPVVDRWWATYSTGDHHRKPFLVLEGPSQVGKTAYARSLCGDPSATLELNCANTTMVQLKAFDSGRHKAIIWDELAAKVVVAEKKVFQAPCCLLDLGASPTGQHVYHVYLADTVHIICSNKWTSDLGGLTWEDRLWITKNQVHVVVDQPLWQQ
jgi:hypothetical protein